MANIIYAVVFGTISTFIGTLLLMAKYIIPYYPARLYSRARIAPGAVAQPYVRVATIIVEAASDDLAFEQFKLKANVREAVGRTLLKKCRVDS